MEKILNIKQVPLKTWLKESDFISIHVPLNDQTHHLIDWHEIFDFIKPTTFIINTSRGGVINNQALICALLANRIAGAGLDVWEDEPDVPPDLIKLENVIFTPHSAGATKRGLIPSAIMAAQNLLDALKGKKPKNLVN
jgi:glyoxylate reductase